MNNQQVNDLDVVISPASDGSGGADAVIKDDKAARAWSGRGKTASEAATQAVRKLLGDRRIREYMP